MKNLLAGIVIGLIAVSASALEPQTYPQHDCNSDHDSETWQYTVPPDSCITDSPGSPDITCDHAWGPAVWASIDANGNSCSYGIACVSIWCSNGKGGWTIKETNMSLCAGKLQADNTGIYCFNDNNSDGRYTTGDTLLGYAGC